ncbi:hypothetical protein XAC3810_70003 [Xanthomonas citri pv. citri]|nr:hypothetical protein XAC3824_100003 [Xanthomonas citri pv. citri]CEE20246.1 hypothetical protein XAC908_100004 [Xanthomonas citri pv. citri]CEE36995.1 hypothetical protein XAC9322_70002 [Xanthomonas citri pv. citri]CEE44571.1 hypothetical protein XAC1083_90003 [Xanthomonas citri pv. citri]CEE45852.1 hypothetical protein XAC902_80004 [Xanthomonas citri pv. citri]
MVNTRSWPEADVSANVCNLLTHVVPHVNGVPRSMPDLAVATLEPLSMLGGRPVAEQAESLTAASACRPLSRGRGVATATWSLSNQARACGRDLPRARGRRPFGQRRHPYLAVTR